MNLSKTLIEESAKQATTTIIIMPRKRPNTFTTAGRAIIPALTIVVDKLNTASVKEAPLSSPYTTFCSCFVGNSGALLATSTLFAFGIFFCSHFLLSYPSEK